MIEGDDSASSASHGQGKRKLEGKKTRTRRRTGQAQKHQVQVSSEGGRNISEEMRQLNLGRLSQGASLSPRNRIPGSEVGRHSIPGTRQQLSLGQFNQGASQSPRNRQNQMKSPKSPAEEFKEYMKYEDVLSGIESKTIIKGDIRINPKNYKEAYISDPDNGKDIAILGVADRNRALEGDVVAIKLKEESEWHKGDDGSVQRTAEVVYLLEKVHSRKTVGLLKNKEKTYALFCPRDHRVPRLQIPLTALPPTSDQGGAKKKGPTETETLYFAMILSWNSPPIAQGIILDELGETGDIKVETEAILVALDLDKDPIPEDLHRYLPPIPYVISQEEIEKRMDLRDRCIFTVDPDTARDLDDAVSISRLGDDEWEVGVHISDVSHFLDEGSPLDSAVGRRATTVYAVQKAYHMLPVQLCLLASLLPGQDKLAVSVFFTVDSEGRSLGPPTFARSVLHSVAQLSYAHAQAVIDGEEVEFPEIYNGFTKEDLMEAIVSLNNLALRMRRQRFERGALQSHQVRLPRFILDSDCSPASVGVYPIGESNRMIEEWMLRANEAVAERLWEEGGRVREMSLLRRHDPPKKKMLDKLEEGLHALGVFLRTETAGELNASIEEHSADSPARRMVLWNLAIKTFMRAQYFCNNLETHHYALHVDLYTHFTSPIRRYADIVVHRLLTSCLGYTQLPASYSSELVNELAKTSNKKKYDAKIAGALSCELFASIYVKREGSVRAKGFVQAVYSYSLDVIVPMIGMVLRAYVQNIDGGSLDYEKNGDAASLLVNWGNSPPQLIQIFSEVDVLLTSIPDSNSIKAELMPATPPIQTL